MDDLIRELRAREFGRLDAAGHVYLDYTGSGLYSESQVRAHSEALCRSVLGNPHSRNPTSQASTALVEDVRDRVREFFNADPDEYEVIFTLNASGALKLVGESYPFKPGSRLVLTADNHNSAHGLREFAAAKGAEVSYVPLDRDLRARSLEEHLGSGKPSQPSLLVFPAQSNFSGVQHPLEWTGLARDRGYDVFLDAAAFVPTSRLSLQGCKPDFVCMSFYKMFGYPTGVGALLARRDALERLCRPWFGGGTVRFVSAQMGVQLLWHTGRGFEDGTLNFLSIMAVPIGLDFMERVGIDRIHDHVTELTHDLLREIQQLRHSNGTELVRIYGPVDTTHRGGTIAFNLLDPDGGVVDFRVVERRAHEANISLRTGYFCNPGAAEFALEHVEADVRRCVQPLTAETYTLQDFANCLEDRAVGAIRVSLGIASNHDDIQRLLNVLREFRDTTAIPFQTAGGTLTAEQPL